MSPTEFRANPARDPSRAPDPTGLLRVGAWAAIASVALIVVQIAVFAAWPPPERVPEIFELMQRNPALGILSLDGLYIVNNLLVVLMYLALAATLARPAPSLTAIALTFGLIGIASYMASNPAFELLVLAGRAAQATGDAAASLEAGGEALLASWRGTAFLVYYELGAIVLLIWVAAMVRTGVYGRATMAWLLASGILMLVPSTAGIVGLVFGVASLVPWSVACILLARHWLRLVRTASGGPVAPRDTGEDSPSAHHG